LLQTLVRSNIVGTDGDGNYFLLRQLTESKATNWVDEVILDFIDGNIRGA